MSTESKVPGGDEQNPGGESGKDQNDSKNESQNQPGAKNSVAYETYQKVLDEAKAAKKRLSEFEKAKRDAEEAKLKQDGEYKTLLEQREQELAEERKAKTELETKISDGRKLNAFLGAMTGEVPKQYWSLIDLENVAMDPATGQPDPASVKRAAEKFEKEYSDVVKRPNKSRLPSGTPGGSDKALGYAEEMKQAKTQKEFDAVLAKYGKLG
jgi:hypothetical protein